MIEWVGAIAFLGGVVVTSTVLFLLLRRTVDFRRLEQHNDVAGFIYAVVGIIYGVLLAFVVIVVWEHHADTEAAIEGEATMITQIYRQAAAFPAPFSQALQTEIRRYTQAVTHHEWQTMHNGRGSERAENALHSLWHTYAAFSPQDANDRAWYSETLQRLDRLVHYRALRLAAAGHRLPAVMWAVLLVGGVTTIGFSYLFGTANTAAHVLMIAGLAIIVALPILLIWSLSHPFQGLGYIDMAPMQHALEIVNRH